MPAEGRNLFVDSKQQLHIFSLHFWKSRTTCSAHVQHDNDKLKSSTLRRTTRKIAWKSTRRRAGHIFLIARKGFHNIRCPNRRDFDSELISHCRPSGVPAVKHLLPTIQTNRVLRFRFVHSLESQVTHVSFFYVLRSASTNTRNSLMRRPPAQLCDRVGPREMRKASLESVATDDGCTNPV